MVQWFQTWLLNFSPQGHMFNWSSYLISYPQENFNFVEDPTNNIPYMFGSMVSKKKMECNKLIGSDHQVIAKPHNAFYF